MEAWKFIDYNSLSPVFALGFTTEQWGFEPFPGNLAAISGSWRDVLESTNHSVQEAWSLPYSSSSCPSSYSSYDCLKSDDSKYSCAAAKYRNVIHLNASSDICGEAEICSLDCTILIEGIGRDTIGPRHTNIVQLSYGISFIVVLITLFIMGSCFSKSTMEEQRPPRRRLSTRQIRPYMTPPGNDRREEDQVTVTADMTREVVECSSLLRQMYALDLAIWAMEDCIPKEVPQRDAMKRKANAIFLQVRRVIPTWMSTPDIWPPQEWKHIMDICKVVEQHELQRYRT